MPPIKGRMMGLQSGRMGGPPQSSHTSLDLSTARGMGLPSKRGKFTGGRGGKTSVAKGIKDEKLKQLRIPAGICKGLPSVRKFSNSKAFIDITDDDDKMDSTPSEEHQILGLKRGRGAGNKYHIKAIAEKRFTGMIWDLLFRPDSEEDPELLVCSGEGIFLCDSELQKKKTLEGIRLAGGAGFLSDGRIVAMCRFMDVINVYSPAGVFLREFSCGQSPMALVVNHDDEILVSDCTMKEILFYQADGTLLRTVPSTGKGYTLKWPLYMDILNNNNFVLVDCHQQTVITFDQRGHYVKSIPMRTYGGNEVLRPHGVCITPEQDLFVVDSAINTVEVFGLNGTYYQTLFPPEEGNKLRPKVVKCSQLGYMAIGGLTGHVKLFKFVDASEVNFDIKQEVKVELQDNVKPKIKVEPKVKVIPQPAKVKPVVKPKVEVKQEIRIEDDDVTVIILD